MSTPVVVDLNPVRIKGWALAAQPFFIYGVFVKTRERMQQRVSWKKMTRLIAVVVSGIRNETHRIMRRSLKKGANH